jgi:nicotinate-nucleotide adenylyltransferase
MVDNAHVPFLSSEIAAAKRTESFQGSAAACSVTTPVHPISARLSTTKRDSRSSVPTWGEEWGGVFDVMRLGLYGGTFDPIHLGHLILAEQCREACRLDRVWFVVAGAPPHKLGERTPVAHRIEMARIATAGHPAFEVSELEAERPGPHYSVDTLEAVHRERPGDELFFLIGADSLYDLPTWRNPAGIAQLATIVVANRPGLNLGDSSLPTTLGPGTKELQFVTIPGTDISSKLLRERLAQGRSIRYMVPRGVEAYIEAQGLYR